LFGFAFVAISIGVEFKCECFIGLFYFRFGGVAFDSKNFIVIFFSGFFLFFFCVFYLFLHVATGVKFLNPAVVHDGSRVLSLFHVDFCSSDQRFRIVWVEFQRFIEVIQSFEGFFALDEGESSVGVDDSVEFLVGGI
jgi:hypothetical protein